MINFIVLGSGPGLPMLDKHLSGVYIKAGEQHILFDCGGGTSRQLLKHNLAQDHLDAIAISHYHPDHVSGIFMVLQMLYLQGRTKPLQLFLPERMEDLKKVLQLFYTFEQRFPYELQFVQVEDIAQYYPKVTPMQTDHLRGYANFIHEHHLPNQMKSFSFRIDHAGAAFVYTSDIAEVMCISPILQGCHTVLVDAMHPVASSVLSLPQYGVERIILTHGLSEELAKCLLESPDTRFETAVEDLLYTI